MKSPHPLLLVLAVLVGVVMATLMTSEIRFTLIGFTFGLMVSPLVGWFAYTHGMQKAVDWLGDLQRNAHKPVIIDQRTRPTVQTVPALPAVPNYMGPRSERGSEVIDHHRPIPVTTINDSDSDIPLIVG